MSHIFTLSMAFFLHYYPRQVSNVLIFLPQPPPFDPCWARNADKLCSHLPYKPMGRRLANVSNS